MKYVSIDIESSGLDIDRCSILEIGLVLDDLEDIKPISELKIARILVLSDGFYCEPRAAVMNADLIKEIADYDYSKGMNDQFVGDNVMQCVCRSHKIPGTLARVMEWFGFEKDSGRYTILPAGKNFDKYDRQMLNRVDWTKTIDPSPAIDPGSMFWRPGDKKLPSLDECMKRSEYDGTSHLHSAVHDALDVVRCIRYAKTMAK